MVSINGHVSVIWHRKTDDQSVRGTYADTLHLSGELVKGDPKIRVRNYVHHLDIPGEGRSKEKTLRNPFAQ